MSRTLHYDGYDQVGYISTAALRLTPGEMEKTESPARRKKVLKKRIPVVYSPGLETFPRISCRVGKN
ncbi:MAG TPA: hypothetical protein VMF08_12780 [Candidatus Sulfotelmatobacter sp.]|nr:hypothetical protein [Candidatus Sulfotelmatobacter sp.]